MSMRTVWLGGLAGVVAGMAYVVAGVAGFFAAPTGSPALVSFADYLAQSINSVALVGTLVAVGGLHVLQRGRYGWLGTTGSLTAATGLTLMLVSTLISLASGEFLERVFVVGSVGSLLVLVGLVLMGAATLGARLLPRWCAVLLIICLPLSLLLEMIVTNAGGILLGAVWASVGYTLSSRGRDEAPPTGQGARVS